MSIPSLADLIRDGERREPPLQPITPLPANYNGELVTVTAILERTAVFYYGADDSEKSMARLDRLDVNFGLFADRARWKVVDGSRRSEHGQPDGREASRTIGRKRAHVMRSSQRTIELRDQRARLAASGLAWCTRAKHEVAIDEMSTQGYWCKACHREYYRVKESPKRLGSSHAAA